jgi:L-seryl-tRNA(Ser) seleniumtransferase
MQTISGKRGTAEGTAAAARMRALPSVARTLQSRSFRRLQRDHGARLITDLLREELDSLRERIRTGSIASAELRAAVSAPSLARRVEAAAAALLRPSPATVINATGVVVHTNLGRSVLGEEAARRVAAAATGYMDLEYDLAAGRRGSRLDHLAPLMRRLFPGAGFVVVNNNAAAIMLTLRALARGKEVVVSRGELVEIGGSFRIPEILAASGARLKEVGTTNRTRLSDYEQAISPRTGLLLKVHTSNFRIVGFTGEASVASLSKLARERSLPLVVDWGSGDLVDLEPLGIRDEIPVGEILRQGADLVTFSGDKLLGGPQAGFAVGHPDLIERLRRDPLARVCRVDRLLIGALRETLAAHLRGRAFEEIPTLRMLSLTADEVGRRATRVLREAARRTGRGSSLELLDGVSRPGGGSSPTGERPTRLLSVRGRGGDAAGIERRLRQGNPPVVGRVHEGRLLLDLRTVLPSQDPALVERLVEALHRDAARAKTRAGS